MISGMPFTILIVDDEREMCLPVHRLGIPGADSLPHHRLCGDDRKGVIILTVVGFDSYSRRRQ
jgi:hypothetical protein